MFEYETLYNTKICQNLSHKKMEMLAAICTMFKMLRGIPRWYSIFFYSVKFQESSYFSQLFDISLFKDISSMYFKKNLIYNKDI